MFTLFINDFLNNQWSRGQTFTRETKGYGFEFVDAHYSRLILGWNGCPMLSGFQCCSRLDQLMNLTIRQN